MANIEHIGEILAMYRNDWYETLTDDELEKVLVY